MATLSSDETSSASANTLPNKGFNATPKRLWESSGIAMGTETAERVVSASVRHKGIDRYEKEKREHKNITRRFSTVGHEKVGSTRADA